MSVGPWRRISPALAFGCTIAGGFLLAYFTRRTGEGLLEGTPIIAALSIMFILVGVVLGAKWLLDELGIVSRDPVIASPSRPAFITVLAVAILVGASAAVTMGQTGELLSGFHLPGEASLNHTAVQAAGSPFERDDKIEEALLTWSRYARPWLHTEEDSGAAGPPVGRAFPSDGNAPLTALAWFFGLDAGLFVPAYFAALGLLLVLGTRSLRERARSPRMSDSAAYSRMARWAAGFLIVAAVSDQIENWIGLTSTASAWFLGDPNVAYMTVGHGVATLLGLATLVKTLSLGLTLTCLVLIGLYLLRNPATSITPWSGVRGAWHSVLAVRIQIIAVLLFAVSMSLRIQAADTFRRWGDDWSVAVVASILVVLLGVAVWHTGAWLTSLGAEATRSGSLSAARWWAVGGAAALVAFGLGAGWRPGWKGLLVPVGIAGILAVLSVAAKGLPVKDPELPGAGAAILPRLLGASVLAFFGLAMIKASSGELIYEWVSGHGLRDLVVLVCLGLLFVFGSMLLFVLLPRRWQSLQHSRWVPSVSLLGCVIAWMLIVAVLDRHVFWIAPRVGTAGVMAGFLVLLTYTLSSAVAMASSAAKAPAPIFRAAGLRRTPVLSLVLVWVLAVSLLPLDFPLHVTVPEETGKVAAEGETLPFAFGDWVEDNCLLGAASSSGGVGGSRMMPAVPLIIVSSSGGGVRAAVWTSFVMDKAFGYTDADVPCSPPQLPGDPVQHPSRWVFALSGISGGGLGFVTYAAQITQGPPSTSAEDRIQDHLGDDSLASTLAWMLFVESPWSLLRFEANRDRGVILQESWERQWPSGHAGLRRNFVDLRRRHDDVPLLILNGASAESGCRFNGSMLDGNGRDRTDAVTGCLEPRGLEGSPEAVLPATIDLVDFLCVGQSISLAKATLFSARFPVISPVGEIQQCTIPAEAQGDAGRQSDPNPETFVVDGGYLEGSGTATALSLWNALTPLVLEHNQNPAATACVVPFFVQIDNGYLEPAGPGDAKAPPNLIGAQELFARNRNREGFTTASRQAAQIAFGQAFTLGGIEVRGPNGVELDSRYARFSPVAHPGAVAPLGWTLSDASFRDLFEQFAKNNSATDELKSWFAGMTCTVTPTQR